MAEHAFWAVFYSYQSLSQIGLTTENNGAAVPATRFFMTKSYLELL